MSKIDDIKDMLDNAEYEYNKRCKAAGLQKHVSFRTMMKGYIFVILIFIGVVIWVL